MKIVKHILLILTATGLMLVSQYSYARHAALLIDAENGNVIYELEANQAWYPASLTKLMTLYMTFSALESGRLHLSQQMSVSSHASHQPTSKLGLRPWDSISVEDAILAIITRSANDAAVVLAEQIAGSEQRFAIKMTSAAHEIGMYGSHFMNATGLPHDWQTTTAHDMALLALKITREFPQYYPYFAADSLYFGGREYRGINKFVANYPGAEGMKTGYTCGSGYNLVASANQYGKRLIGVVLGGMTSSERYDHMFTMMDIGFSNPYSAYHTKNISSMSKNSIGIPPYQLSCGHRPSSHYAARHLEEDEDDHPIRYIKKSSHVSHIASSKRFAEPTHITKVSVKEKTKTIVKPIPEKKLALKTNKQNLHVSNKAETKPKLALATTKPNKKVIEPVKKNKSLAKAPAKVIQVAANNPHGKGYYVPSKKTKPTTTSSSDSKKSKSYYKPESSNKASTKSETKKNKHTSKK